VTLVYHAANQYASHYVCRPFKKAIKAKDALVQQTNASLKKKAAESRDTEGRQQIGAVQKTRSRESDVFRTARFLQAPEKAKQAKDA